MWQFWSRNDSNRHPLRVINVSRFFLILTVVAGQIEESQLITPRQKNTLAGMENSMFSTHSVRLPKIDLANIDYLKALARIAAIFLSIGSYLTSFLGACLYVSNNIPVAFLLSTGFQIGVFVFSHGAGEVRDARHLTISRVVRLCAFVPCLAFSAYMSTLGTYDVLRPSLEAGDERAALQSRFNAAAYAQNQLSTAALGYVNEHIAELEPLIQAQKRKLLSARMPYTRGMAQRALDKFAARLNELNRAKEVITNIPPMSDIPPETPEEARRQIELSTANSSSILAVMPAEFRDTHAVAQPEFKTAGATDIQGSFIYQLRSGAPAAYYCLAIALLLDVTSILIIRSITPIPTLPERIRRMRRYVKELHAARSEPLDFFRQELRVVVAGFPDLNLILDLGTESPDLYLDDLKSHFRYLEDRLSAEANQRVEIRSVISSTGMELLPELPLKSQLDADNTIHLVTELVNERANKT